MIVGSFEITCMRNRCPKFWITEYAATGVVDKALHTGWPVVLDGFFDNCAIVKLRAGISGCPVFGGSLYPEVKITRPERFQRYGVICVVIIVNLIKVKAAFANTQIL